VARRERPAACSSELGLPYRKILLCGPETGFSASVCYDLEVLFPSVNSYREISSCSNCKSFQANRLKIRYRRNRVSSNRPVKPVNEFCHTINASGLALGRALLAVLENYQVTLNGSINVAIPQVLRPFFHGKEFLVD